VPHDYDQECKYTLGDAIEADDSGWTAIGNTYENPDLLKV
jgi:hypothetical protein